MPLHVSGTCAYHQEVKIGIITPIGVMIPEAVLSNKHSGTLHEDRYSYMTIPRSVLLRMRKISENDCKENQNHSVIKFSRFADRASQHIYLSI